MRSRASSFKWKYPLLSLRSSSSFLRLLPIFLSTRLLVKDDDQKSLGSVPLPRLNTWLGRKTNSTETHCCGTPSSIPAPTYIVLQFAILYEVGLSASTDSALTLSHRGGYSNFSALFTKNVLFKQRQIKLCNKWQFVGNKTEIMQLQLDLCLTVHHQCR